MTNLERDAQMIDRHRRGVPVAAICNEFGVTHTILYKTLATADPLDRHARITPWTEDDDRALILGQDATAQAIADEIGRTKGAVKWRRGVLRRRGDLPPV